MHAVGHRVDPLSNEDGEVREKSLIKRNLCKISGVEQAEVFFIHPQDKRDSFCVIFHYKPQN